jgi:cell division protein FtsZ
VRGVELVAVDTDRERLDRVSAGTRVAIGGRPAGGDWTGGRDAAEEHRGRLAEALGGADVAFVIAGMGGGTGTGASGVVAEVARAAGALTIGVVTRPFRFEGRVRNRTADAGIERLRERVDALIVVPNDRLTQVVDRKTTLEEAFRIADDVLGQAVQAIVDLVAGDAGTAPGLDAVRAIVAGAGEASLGIGFGSGSGRCEEAARQAVACPLMASSVDGARGVLVNVTGGPDVTSAEAARAVEIVRSAAAPGARVAHGHVVDRAMAGELRVTVVAVGGDPRPEADQAGVRAPLRPRSGEPGVACRPPSWPTLPAW